MRILVFGGTGQLGTSLVHDMRRKKYIYRVISRKACNINTFELAKNETADKLISQHRATHVINLIALTNVDTCEIDIDLAKVVNEEIAEKIAKGCNKNGARLIHISTDQVYSLNQNNSENDCMPINAYGLTKLRGEERSLSNNDNTLILRTNFIGKDERILPRSLVDWMLNNINSGEELKVFKDVRFNPLNTRELCKIIDQVLKNENTGSYNVGSKGELTKHELALKLRDAVDPSYSRIRGISIDEMNLKAKRPKCMLMNISKFEKDFNIYLPDIEQTLEKTIREIK